MDVSRVEPAQMEAIGFALAWRQRRNGLSSLSFGEPTMLVVSREVGESIVIGSSIVVRIVRVQGDRVRIGVEAPFDVPVFRGEVFEEIASGNAKDPSIVERIKEFDIAISNLGKGVADD